MNDLTKRLGLGETPDWQVNLGSAEQTRALGAAIAKTIKPPCFIGLVGDLGAGKTTLVQGVVGELGEVARATSPTYTLLNEYRTEPPVVHVDLYRLETVDDLESVGYWDYVLGHSGFICVEWLDRIPGAWPDEGLVIGLEFGDGRAANIWDSSDSDRLSRLKDGFS